MQVALGIHALLGAALFLWAIRAQGNLIGAVPLVWILVWWLVVRSRPWVPRAAQPPALFTFKPSVVMGMAQFIAAVYFLTSFTLFDSVGDAVLVGEGCCFVGGPICMLSWAAAGIRFHVGTWVLAWGISIAGMFVAAHVLHRHAASV
jgi:hypothetical protein